MLLEQARSHFVRLGWDVSEAPAAEPGAVPLRASLFASKGEKRRAVLVDEEPLTAYQVGSFAAACKRNHVQGVVVCPQSEGLVDACDAAGVDYLSPEGLGAPVFLPKAKPPVPLEVPVPVATAPAVVEMGTPESTRTRWWRWGIVAVIWAAALYLVVRLILDVLRR